jgi:hypothetical protein
MTKKQKGRKSMASAANGDKKEGRTKPFLGENTIKGPTQVNGHSLKLHFFMFERSQVKHNNFGLSLFFLEYFSLNTNFTCSKHSNLKSGQCLFFSNVFFFYQMCIIYSQNWKGL